MILAVNPNLRQKRTMPTTWDMFPYFSKPGSSLYRYRSKRMKIICAVVSAIKNGKIKLNIFPPCISKHWFDCILGQVSLRHWLIFLARFAAKIYPKRFFLPKMIGMLSSNYWIELHIFATNPSNFGKRKWHPFWAFQRYFWRFFFTQNGANAPPNLQPKLKCQFATFP